MEEITALAFPIFLAFVGRLPAKLRTLYQKADQAGKSQPRSSDHTIPMPGAEDDERVESHATAHWMILLVISLWVTVFMNRTLSEFIMPGLDFTFRMNLLVFICCLHLVLFLLVVTFVARIRLDKKDKKSYNKGLESIRRVNAVGVFVLGLFILFSIQAYV